MSKHTKPRFSWWVVVEHPEGRTDVRGFSSYTLARSTIAAVELALPDLAVYLFDAFGHCLHATGDTAGSFIVPMPYPKAPGSYVLNEASGEYALAA